MQLLYIAFVVTSANKPHNSTRKEHQVVKLTLFLISSMAVLECSGQPVGTTYWCSSGSLHLNIVLNKIARVCPGL